MPGRDRETGMPFAVSFASALTPREGDAGLAAMSPDEVAHAVLYLASPRAGSTTGTEIAVDGGMAGLRLRPRT